MDSKKIVEDIFIKNGINWKVKEFGKYVDPKCKSAKSIYSKLVRLYYSKNFKEEFTVLNSGINDLLRMTIIVEYSEMINVIHQLKEYFPDMTGYLKVKSSGYRGVHLNFKFDGIPCEIQLAPKIVVMAVDYLHTLHEKWRDFDSDREKENIEKKEQKVLAITNLEEKTRLMKIIKEEKNILRNKVQEEKRDYELRKKTYHDVFMVTNFFQYQDEIEKCLKDLIKEKSEYSLITNIELIKIFNINLLSNRELDKSNVMQVARKLSNNIEKSQIKFVDTIKAII